MRSTIHVARWEAGGAEVRVWEKAAEDPEVVQAENYGHASLERRGAHHAVVLTRRDGTGLALEGLSQKAARELHECLSRAIEEARAIYSPLKSLRSLGAILENLAKNADPRILVNALIIQAHHVRASDIHLKPGAGSLNVEYRIDGLLAPAGTLPLSSYEHLLSCIKNMARLVSYKRSIPQDGSIRFSCFGIDLDVRVAVLPTLFGERAVLRLLNPNRQIPALESLGLSEEMLRSYREVIRQPQGTILLTGPAGSGKTTTIFSSLLEISAHRRDTVNISTIEDPIEYVVEKFAQTQVNPAMGLTFSSGLRTLLRQDPDVILVGEIRDGETASIAMQAALSGHLIFSTLHSPGTAGVFSRLIEMGVEPFLASSCVSSVLSQRLLRVVCGQCARASAPDEGLRKEFESYGIAADTVMHGVGCEACGGTGYSGRTGIFELLALTPTLREAVHRKTPYRVLHKAARDEGLRTLRRDGLEKIALGLTTFEEIARVCPPEED